MIKKEFNKKQNLALIKTLVNSTYFFNRIPDRETIDKQGLQKVCDNFNKRFINTQLISEIISNYAFDEVLNKTKHDDSKLKGKIMFSNILNLNSDNVTKKIYDLILTLPKKYTFIFKLPHSSQLHSKIDFNYNIKIFFINTPKARGYLSELTSVDTLADIIANFRRPRGIINKDDLVLAISGKGYVGEYGSIKLNLPEDPLYIFKVIIGIYIALGILHRKEKVDYLQPYSSYSYDIFDSNKKIIRNIVESTDDAQYLNNLEFDNSKFSLTAIDNLMKNKETQFDIANKIITNLFSPILFAKKKSDKNLINKLNRIKNGAYWFYESLKTQQDHVRVIFLTTAFDSLLNLQGKDDTKEYKALLISNLISNNSFDSEITYKYIHNLYSLRNDVVHGQKSISSIEKYNDNKLTTVTICSICLNYLHKFLFNRLFFINGGLEKVIKMMNK